MHHILHYAVFNVLLHRCGRPEQGAPCSRTLWMEILGQQEGVAVRSWSSRKVALCAGWTWGPSPRPEGTGVPGAQLQATGLPTQGPAAGGTHPDCVCRRAGGQELLSSAAPCTGWWGGLSQAGLGMRSTAVRKPGAGSPAVVPGRGQESSGLMKEATLLIPSLAPKFAHTP